MIYFAGDLIAKAEIIAEIAIALDAGIRVDLDENGFLGGVDVIAAMEGAWQWDRLGVRFNGGNFQADTSKILTKLAITGEGLSARHTAVVSMLASRPLNGRMVQPRKEKLRAPST